MGAQELTHSNFLLIKKSDLFVLSYPQVWQAQIILSPLSLSSPFCNFLYFQGNGYNYDRAPLNDQGGTNFLSAQ